MFEQVISKRAKINFLKYIVFCLMIIRHFFQRAVAVIIGPADPGRINKGLCSLVEYQSKVASVNGFVKELNRGRRKIDIRVAINLKSVILPSISENKVIVRYLRSRFSPSTSLKKGAKKTFT